MSIANTLSLILYPARCPVCHGILTSKETLICPDCVKKVPYIKEPVCMKCGKEMEEDIKEYCPDCQKNTFAFDYGAALFNYTDIIRDSLSRFKYHNCRDYAHWYGKEMAGHLGHYIQNIKADLMIPVPLHKKRARIRGYNQSELLAEELGLLLNIPVRTDILVRTKPTLPQKNLNYIERQLNLQDTFKGNFDLTGIKRVILIDDIYTTGSTLDACAKELKRCGVSHVYFAVAAIGKN